MAHGHDFVDEYRDPADYTGADAQYFETPKGAGYEHTDASVWTITKFGIWLAISALIVHVGLGFMYSMLIEQATDLSEPRYPLAAAREQPVPTVTPLQRDPATDIYRFRVQEEAELTQYGWANREAGQVRIPIDEAMRRVVAQGLPSRTPEAAQPPATSGLLASDASAGRVMERRRQ
jgi:hypothetical protein